MEYQYQYPPVPLSWAQGLANLTERERAFGIQQGFLSGTPADEELVRNEPWLAVLQGSNLADTRDLLFRLLLINLFKHWFLVDRPLRALEFLVLDFEDCPSVDGILLSGIAGISEGNQTQRELDPEYFERKVRVFRFLTEFVIGTICEGGRKLSV